MIQALHTPFTGAEMVTHNPLQLLPLPELLSWAAQEQLMAPAIAPTTMASAAATTGSIALFLVVGGILVLVVCLLPLLVLGLAPTSYRLWRFVSTILKAIKVR